MADQIEKKLLEEKFKSTVMPKEHGASHQQSQGLPGVQIPTGEQLKAFEQSDIGQKVDAKELNAKIDQAKKFAGQ